EWGDAAVERFNGMFAFAVWDAGRRRLLLTRDRYGIKPLYYTRIGSVFAFASEIKALLRHPMVSARISLEALNEYFPFQNIFTDLALFEGVRLLPPATTLSFTLGSPDPAVQRYWDYRFDTTSFQLSESDAADCLYGLFERAVSRQLVADVPVGSYLSGGM